VNKVIITGGAGTGKSSLLSVLGQDVEVAEEVSREIILKYQRFQNEISPWGDIERFCMLCLERMIQQYQAQKSVFCVYDRAIPDLIVWLKFRGAQVASKFYQAVDDHLSGSLVFFAPPWSEIYMSDVLRPETFEESVVISELTRRVYRDLGFKLIELEKQCPKKRAKQMKEVIFPLF